MLLGYTHYEFIEDIFKRIYSDSAKSIETLINMKEKIQYITPQIEEVVFKNENGFAISGNAPEGFTEGGSPNLPWATSQPFSL